MTGSSGRELEGAVPLSEAIQSLRDELTRAGLDGQQKFLKFRANSVELTLQAVVTVSGKAAGGVKWWLVDAQGELSRQSAATQTVKITLDPVVFDQAGNPTHLYVEAKHREPDPE